MDYKESYFSPGKLLITGEYLVIDGAKAFALPTKKGQWLKVNSLDNNEIHWTSLGSDNTIWFEGKFSSRDFSILETSDKEIAKRLKAILIAASELDPNNHLNDGWDVLTELEFPNNWGLGSSSTLLCNISKWLKIDSYQLHFSVSNGSGYDIASGMESSALIYSVSNQVPKIEKIVFNPSFKHSIYFIHLNQKQQSDIEVGKYKNLKKDIELSLLTKKIDEITNHIIQAKDLQTFENYLSEHEQVLSHLLQMESSHDDLFKNYKGGITKYLGAWGGDFILATAHDINDLSYFIQKGYKTILTFDEMIKN